MINDKRIVPITQCDLISMYGLILKQDTATLAKVDAATDDGTFNITAAATALIASEPVKSVDFAEAYRFLRRPLRYSGILTSFRIFQFIVIHTVKGFGIVNKAEIDVFLELSCFFHDPADVGNLISGSSAFSKTSLNIRKFTVHILLKPGLENFEHYFTSV